MSFDSALPFGSLIDRAHFLRVSMLAVVAGSACHTPGTPRIDGVAGAPANPATPWTVPASARTPPPPAAPPAAPAATAALAADSATTAAVRFSLTDVVDLALKNNPTTRESWANAQAAANEYGSARGARYPTLNGSVNLAGASTGSAFGGGGGGNGSSVVIDTTGSNTRAVGAVGGLTRAQITPAFSLSYLVFDMGGRAATIESAKQNAVALNLGHNAAINDVVLQVESALFSYLATVALRDAELTALKEAQADTANAEARLRVGVGTLQDVLQARTELAQARLQLVTLEGTLLSSRATLAAAMGLPANTRFEIPAISTCDSVAKVAASVDTLINRAITTRPDLAQARAAAAQLAAQIRVARSAGYPSLTLSSIQSVTRSVEGASSANGLNASFVLGLQIPIFNGYSRAVRRADGAGPVRGRAGARHVDAAADHRPGVHVVRGAADGGGSGLPRRPTLLPPRAAVRRSRHGPISRGRGNDRRRAARAQRAGLGARRGHTGALGVADGARAAGARRRFARHARPSEHSARAGAEDSMIARRRRIACAARGRAGMGVGACRAGPAARRPSAIPVRVTPAKRIDAPVDGRRRAASSSRCKRWR